MANTEGAEKKGKFKKLTPKYLLEEIEAEGDAKNTLVKSVAQVAISTVAGSLIGSFCGNYSFLIGPVLIGVGNYKDYAWMAPLGTGMMAAAFARPKDPPKTPKKDASGKELSGFDFHEEMSDAKQRALHWKDAFMSRTYLDKVFKKKAAEQSGSGSGTQQRKFVAEEQPEEVNGLSDAPGDAQNAIDEIEKQLVASAMEFQRKQQSQKQMQGTDPDLMGLEEEVDFSKL